MSIDRRHTLKKLVAAGVAAATPLRVGAASKDPYPRTRDYVVALVRSNPRFDPKARPVQRIEPVALKDEGADSGDNLPVIDWFVGDLFMRYAFDDPQFTPFLRARDVKRLNISREELPTLVVKNFRRLYPKVTVAFPDRWLGVVTQGGELEPCTMLDGAFWGEQMKHFGGELVAAVPSVQEVYFTPREPRQNIELLKHLAVNAYDKAGARAVSRTVFGWRNFRWEVVS